MSTLLATSGAVPNPSYQKQATSDVSLLESISPAPNPEAATPAENSPHLSPLGRGFMALGKGIGYALAYLMTPLVVVVGYPIGLAGIGLGTFGATLKECIESGINDLQTKTLGGTLLGLLKIGIALPAGALAGVGMIVAAMISEEGSLAVAIGREYLKLVNSTFGYLDTQKEIENPETRPLSHALKNSTDEEFTKLLSEKGKYLSKLSTEDKSPMLKEDPETILNVVLDLLEVYEKLEEQERGKGKRMFSEAKIFQETIIKLFNNFSYCQYRTTPDLETKYAQAVEKIGKKNFNKIDTNYQKLPSQSGT